MCSDFSSHRAIVLLLQTHTVYHMGFSCFWDTARKTRPYWSSTITWPCWTRCRRLTISWERKSIIRWENVYLWRLIAAATCWDFISHVVILWRTHVLIFWIGHLWNIETIQFRIRNYLKSVRHAVIDKLFTEETKIARLFAGFITSPVVR